MTPQEISLFNEILIPHANLVAQSVPYPATSSYTSPRKKTTQKLYTVKIMIVEISV